MKHILIILSLIILSSCSSTLYKGATHSDPDLLPYFKDFIKDHQSSDILNVDHGIVIYFKNYENMQIGYCVLRTELKDRELIINYTRWRYATEAQRKHYFDKAMTDCVYEKPSNRQYLYLIRI